MHFSLVAVHFGVRSISAVSGVMLHKVCNLVEQSDTLHCRTSAQPAILYSCGK